MTDTTERTDSETVHDRRAGFGSLGSIIHLLALTWVAAIASFPLSDNSFLTHLATGRIILDEGRVPTRDPYTFTAAGEPWTVQSWLASVAYAGFERLGGEVGLRLLVLGVFLIAGTLLWRLTAPAPTVIGRLLLTALGLLIATGLWGERPYMIGIIGLSIVWLALQGRVPAWTLVPLLWIWTNAHGSFPLAVALCLAVWLGAALDQRSEPEPSARPGLDRERRVTGAVVLGVLLGAVGPLGLRVLWFPLTAVTKGEVFAEIIEWQPPTYRSSAERAFFVLVVVTVLLLSRGRSWRLTLPAVGFAASALYAQRNIVMATVVLIAVSATSSPELGALRSWDRPGLGRAMASIVGLLALATGGLAVLTPVAGFGGYPTRALAYVEATGLEGPVATEMPAGNLLGVLDGPIGQVFIDDRVDMYPEEVFEDFLTLRRGQPGWDEVLDRYEIKWVVWARDEPLAAMLASSGEWLTAFSDTNWVAVCQRSACGATALKRL